MSSDKRFNRIRSAPYRLPGIDRRADLALLLLSPFIAWLVGFIALSPAIGMYAIARTYGVGVLPAASIGIGAYVAFLLHIATRVN